MATRHVLYARQTVGISPRRLMAGRRHWSADRATARRNANASVLQNIETFLVALRRAGRRAILIIDTDCGNGRRLIDAAFRARARGFLAIDAWGFDKSPGQIGEAARAAEARIDPAIGFRFSVLGEGAHLLVDEDDGSANLILASVRRPLADIIHALDRDGLLVRHD